jgi:hypothetical protein
MDEIKRSASTANQHLYGHSRSHQKVDYLQWERHTDNLHMICVCGHEQELLED